MTTSLIVLVAVALILALSITRPTFPTTAPKDRDLDRQLAELLAHGNARADIALRPDPPRSSGHSR